MQQVRNIGEWEPWIIFILDAVEQTSLQTAAIIRDIKELMAKHKHNIRSELPKIYSQDLINNLFRHPYTKIEYIKTDLGITRKTAARYREQLCSINILNKNRIGKENYYFNDDLIALLSNVTNLKKDTEEAPQIITSSTAG